MERRPNVPVLTTVKGPNVELEGVILNGTELNNFYLKAVYDNPSYMLGHGRRHRRRGHAGEGSGLEVGPMSGTHTILVHQGVKGPASVLLSEPRETGRQTDKLGAVGT